MGADLPDTLQDAIGLGEIFSDPGCCAFPARQVKLLTGPQAGRGAILAALDNLAKQADENATLVVFFSRQGYRASHPALGSQYYLRSYGYDTGDLPGSAISGKELAEKLAAIPARKILLLLDCCHAGGVGGAKAPGLEFAKAPLPADVLPRLEASRGRELIASCQADELSYAGKPYSEFALALLEALAGEGVAKKDGLLRIAELALYTRQVVPGRTHDRPHPILPSKGRTIMSWLIMPAGIQTPKG